MRLLAGQSAWVVQRVSALVLLALLVVALALLAAGAVPDYGHWHALAASAHGAVLILLFFVALAAHAWIGVRDVVLDYLHPPALRLAVLAVVAVLLTGVLLRVLLALAGLR